MKGCRPLSDPEIQSLLTRLPIRERVLILTGLYFGTRISETLSLTFGEVTGRFIHINSAKSSNNVSFEVPASYQTDVAALRTSYEAQGLTVADDTRLFLSRKGINQAISRQQASDLILNAKRELGIEGKVNTHSFRKTFVTKIYHLTGRDIAETKKYSRHKSLANLDYYIGTTEDLSLVGKLTWGNQS